MSDFRIRIQAELDAKKLTSQINALKQNKIKIPVEFDLKNADLQKALSGLTGKSSKVKIDVDTSEIQKGKTAIDGLKTSASQLSKFQFKVNTSGITAELSKIKTQIDRFKQQSMTDGQQAQVEKITASYLELAQVVSDVSAKTRNGTLDTDDIDRYNNALKTTQNQIKILSSELSSIASIDDRMQFSNKIETWLNNNTKATDQAKVKLQEYIAMLRDAGTVMTTGQMNDVKKGFNTWTSSMQAMGRTGKSFFDDFKRAFSQIFQFAGAYGLIQNVAFQVPQQMVQAVRDINASQIELRKVTDASESQLTAYWDEAAASAQKYGAAINEVINSTADWQRLGYSFDESKELSDLTTLIQRVGDNMTQESSSQGLISTLQGFQLAADEAQKVVDITNEVANTQPIDTAGIFAGLQRSASSMSAANNTLEETIALITAGNAVLQDPERVGNGLKTISMRIRGATTELEEAGESTEGMAESTAALRKEVMALAGVDIMENDTTFKNTYQILDELSTKWSDLTDIQQASLTELLAGKYQGNLMSSILGSFDIARQSLDTALNDSAGSAERELENYQKGIEYSLDTFNAQFQELSTQLINADVFKGLVDGGTAFLNILTQIIDVGGGLPAVLATISTFMGAKGHGKRKVIVSNALSYKVA